MRAMTLTFCLLAASVLHADTLTVAQAIQIGLEHNFGIRIARNDAAGADNTRALKAGGLLPSLAATASSAYTTTKTDAPATMPGGSGSDGWSTSAGASLSWTLFDGFRMFYAFRQVEQQAQLGETASRQTIESSVVEIASAFYGLVSARSLLDAAREQLQISRRTLQRVKAQHEYGRASRRQLLSARVQVNADSSAVHARELDAITAHHTLNVLLGRGPDTDLQVSSDTIAVVPEHDADYWSTQAAQHNAGLQLTDIQRNIAASQAAIARAAFWPVLAANGSYTYTWSDVNSSRASAGFTLTLPILQGFSRLVTARNARLNEESADLTYQQQALSLQAFVYQQWERLQNACQSVSFEQDAVALASESLTIAEEEHRLGRISDTELREAQLALLNARVRLESAVFQSKLVEMQVRQLGGKLRVE